MTRGQSTLLFFSALFGVSVGLFAQEGASHKLDILIKVPAEAMAEKDHSWALEIQRLERVLENRVYEPEKLQSVMESLGYKAVPEKNFVGVDQRFDVFCSVGKLALAEEQLLSPDTNPDLERLIEEERNLRKILFQTEEFQKFYAMQVVQDSIDDQNFLLEYVGDILSGKSMIQDSELKSAFLNNAVSQAKVLAAQRKKLEDHACVAVYFSGKSHQGEWTFQKVK